MKIYTKTGDDGTTGLFGGGRVAKNDARVEAYGTVDETNAVIGLARAAGLPKDVDSVLANVQGHLFVLGAELACVPGKEDKLSIERLTEAEIGELEQAIDSAESSLEPLKTFILPGGHSGAAALHLARTVCRRAERRTQTAGEEAPIRDQVKVYLNRLSDLLFVLARRANQEQSIEDVPWNPRG